MAWLDSILGRKPVGVATRIPDFPQPSTKHKAAFHVRRFTLALEQCEKGEARRAELRRWLDYWLSVQAAEAALEAAGR